MWTPAEEDESGVPALPVPVPVAVTVTVANVDGGIGIVALLPRLVGKGTESEIETVGIVPTGKGIRFEEVTVAKEGGSGALEELALLVPAGVSSCAVEEDVVGVPALLVVKVVMVVAPVPLTRSVLDMVGPLPVDPDITSPVPKDEQSGTMV